LFSTLICVYENLITVNIVKPLYQRPFMSTLELYNNNYTFVVQRSQRVRDWLDKEYNRTNHLNVSHAADLNEWLSYFLNHTNEIKYAIVGQLDKHFHYRAVSLVRERNGTCYQMFPNEKAFSPEPFYFHFSSAVAYSLRKGVSRIRASGLLRAVEIAQDFRRDILATNLVRLLAAKYENDLPYEDLQNNRLKQSLITLGNFKSVLYAVLIITLLASFAFIAEVCTFHHINRSRVRKITLVMIFS